MNPILNGFMESWKNRRSGAFFEGDQKAAEISSQISKNQTRKFKRHQIVPPAFYVYLRESEIIKKDVRISEGGSTIEALLDFLRWYPYETQQARSGGEYLFREIIKADVPFLSKAFALGDHVWEKGQFFRVPSKKASKRQPI